MSDPLAAEARRLRIEEQLSVREIRARLGIGIRFIEATGRSRKDLRYRVSIHENADAEAAGRWWAGQLGIGPECLQRPTLKRHKPQTTRLNVGENYRGCLVVRVPKARQL